MQLSPLLVKGGSQRAGLEWGIGAAPWCPLTKAWIRQFHADRWWRSHI